MGLGGKGLGGGGGVPREWVVKKGVLLFNIEGLGIMGICRRESF